MLEAQPQVKLKVLLKVNLYLLFESMFHLIFSFGVNSKQNSFYECYIDDVIIQFVCQHIHPYLTGTYKREKVGC